MPRRVSENTVMVIGLGLFGSELAKTLVELDREVLAIERDPGEVAKMAPLLTLAVEGDGTNIETLRSLGAEDVNTAVVAIGSSLEASVLATSALSELGVENIWAKAVTTQHKAILEKVGARHVVFPELDMGNRVAHQLVQGADSEYIEFANGFAIALLMAPKQMEGKSLSESRLLSTTGVSCVGVQRAGTKEFEAVDPKTRIAPKDLLVIAGRTQDVERFSLGRI